MAEPCVLILIPAAGASARMGGRDKLLEEVDGLPLLARQVAAAGIAGTEVLVTLPPDRPERAAAVQGLGATVADVPEAAEGMAASLRAGARAAQARGCDGMMVLPPDMPGIEAGDIVRVIAAFDGRQVVRAENADGVAGHPVILPARLFDRLGALTGDQGARQVLEGEQVLRVPLEGDRATLDLDTPEAWARWRALRDG